MTKDNIILDIHHLSKTFGTNVVLKDIDFSVSTGDVTCIIGASGSGKSTLLRCLNLLETPTTGEVLYHGEDITNATVNAASYRSHVGMVFQNFNLFNNMDVLKNCMVGQMKVLKRDAATAKKNALFFLDKVGMAPYINAKPRQLSGGLEVMRTLAGEGLTMIIVTHEMAFARDVSNHVVFMADGVIAEEGSPAQIFENPQNAQTKEFLSRFMRG